MAGLPASWGVLAVMCGEVSHLSSRAAEKSEVSAILACGSNCRYD